MLALYNALGLRAGRHLPRCRPEGRVPAGARPVDLPETLLTVDNMATPRLLEHMETCNRRNILLFEIARIMARKENVGLAEALDNADDPTARRRRR